MRDSRYDILFEPVQIGPVIAKNRFYQVPHCTGSGSLRPRILAHLRETKAEGGWAVVNTEYCSVHPSSDDLPHPSASLWDERDIKAHALMTEKVHAHGALAGVELCLGGARMANLESRETALSVGNLPNLAGNPFQTRHMDLHDIREARRWHKNAALRAKKAGFDLVYVYATHGYLISQFLSNTTNSRTDEYGGSIENRVRLLREIIEDTKEAVGDTMAVAVRFSSETNGGYEGGDGNPMPGETEEMIGILGELPDLWDINVNDYSLEMGLSRFVPEGSLEPYVKSIKSMTSKPVVSVGRFTSPDTMASQIKRGILDFIGAARPSIADPFLPKKIEEGRIEDIRECIGCNICYTGDGKGVPIRCTQNPTMSEEWRRGWHPEKVNPGKSTSSILIVGAGPSGLEAAHILGKRGYHVMLAEATRGLGGRVNRESRLPGLGQWIRVRDYRLQQIEKLKNVEVFRESEMNAQEVMEIGADHVAIATGASWRRDGFGANALSAISNLGPAAKIYTPDDIMAGNIPQVPTLVYDDDHYYMGAVLAEMIRGGGAPVTLVTPEDVVSSWGAYTYDRWRSQARLMDLQVVLNVSHSLASFDGEKATLCCNYTGRASSVAAEALVLVTARKPNDALYHQLIEAVAGTESCGIKSLKRIGDCDAPAIIAAAVFSGHRYARELEEQIDPDNPLKFDRVLFEDAF
ncbi:MAG: NAD(P)-binding protein [Rhizobiaceae bacterium]